MRKHLLAATALVALFGSSAIAADMPAPVYKAPPPPPVWSWSGFYIGGQVGADWGTAEASLNANNVFQGLSGPVAQTEQNGFLAGGLIGLNWQFASWGSSASRAISTGPI